MKVKFIVVGLGRIGMRHATIIHEHPDTELVGIVDTDTKVQNKELYPKGVPFATSLEALWTKGVQPDVVNICTPNNFHVPLALKVLDKGFHAVIEKPMGLSRASCETVIHKALQAAKHVFVVKQNRYSPPSIWLKKIVQQKVLGDIYNVQINCYWNRDDRYYNGGWKGTLEHDGGVLFTQFSHFIDIMYWVFGDIKNIQTKFFNFNHQQNTEFEDSGLATFEFEQGGMGSLNFSTAIWDQNLESSITVIGSKGSIKIGGQYMNEIEYCHVQDYTMPILPKTNPPNDYGPFKGSAANHHYVIQNVVDTIRGIDTMTTNALEGLKVVDIIERIYADRNLQKIMNNTNKIRIAV